MFRKHTFLICLIAVLFGLVLWFSFGQAVARPMAQTDPTPEWDEGWQVSSDVTQAVARPMAQTDLTPEWDEGRPVTSDATQGDIAIPSVATAPATSYRTFSGTRFQPTSSALTYSASGGAVYATALPAGGFSFSLDFDLPHGATITEVVFFVIDNDAANIGLSLRSYNPQTDVFTTLESATSSGASTTLQTIVIPVDPPVQVDNTTTTYRLRFFPGIASSRHLLRGARIGYTVSQSFLPLVTK